MAATATATTTKYVANSSREGPSINSSGAEESKQNTKGTDPCSLKGLIGLKKRAIRDHRLRVRKEMANNPRLGCAFLTELSDDELRERLGPSSWTWFEGVKERIRSEGPLDAPQDATELTDVDIDVWKTVVRGANQNQTLLDTASNILIMFLALHDEACGPVKERRDEIRVNSVTTGTELWSAAEGELGEITRAEVAETILSELFQEGRPDGVKAVVDAYESFVSKVVFCEPQAALSAIEGIWEDDAKCFRAVQGKAWTDVVQHAVLPIILVEDEERKFEVEELVAFLKFPYKIGLRLSRDADKVWDELLFKALSLAESANKTLLLFDLIKEIKRGGMNGRRKKKRRADERSEEGTSATGSSKRTRRDGDRASE